MNLCRYCISLYVPVELRCRCFYAINRRRMLVCYDLMTALKFIPEVSNQHFSRVRVDASSVVLERCWRSIFSRSMVKTHHHIIFFVRPRHSKPGIESYCCSSTDQLSWWAYGAVISQAQTNFVDYEGIHHGRMCFKSVKTLGDGKI